MTVIQIPPGSPFGVENLPYGVFSVAGGSPRIGVRVGDSVIDLSVVLTGNVDDEVFAASSLNPFMAQGPARWARVREQTASLSAADLPAAAVHAVGEVTLHLPAEVGDYVDFYASEHHASNLGRLFRPDAEPLLPNWKHLPVGYTGRAGTIVVSGTDIVRPCGLGRSRSEHPSRTPELRPPKRHPTP
jgi:fumarylacetoacetase